MTASVDTPIVAAAIAPHPPTSLAAILRSLAVLFKIRIVGLLLFAGAGGAFLAAGGWPGFGPLGLMTLTGGLAAMGAAALNQYLEQTEDATMRRTRRRPLVTGALGSNGWVPGVGLILIFVPSLAVLPFNPALTFFSICGAIIYAGLYTLWLKPRTVTNIVIGGAAGTCAVLSGGAAVGHWSEPGVIALGLLVFLWTPIHFWSLAILYREDYALAGVPMLPVRVSLRGSALWVALHGVAVGVAALALAAHPALGRPYFSVALMATGGLIWRCAPLVANPVPKYARAAFIASNIYLALILLLICIDTLI